MQRHSPGRHCRGLAAVLLACVLQAQAQQAQPQAQLVDPTRPRMAMQPGVVTTPARSDGVTAPRAWPTLQSVQTPTRGEASAMIDGQIFHVGERVGEATLTAIGAQGIVLRTAHYEQHISLTPGIAKTASATVPSAPNPPAVALATKEHR
jgi:hypothetical protein